MRLRPGMTKVGRCGGGAGRSTGLPAGDAAAELATNPAAEGATEPAADGATDALAEAADSATEAAEECGADAWRECALDPNCEDGCESLLAPCAAPRPPSTNCGATSVNSCDASSWSS